MNRRSPSPHRGRSIERLVAAPFHRVLDGIDAGLSKGALEASLPDGTTRLLGGRRDGPLAIVDLRRWRALLRLALRGSIGWYEAWAAEEWTSPDPVALFELFVRNAPSLRDTARPGGLVRIAELLGHWWRRNHPAGARRNIAAHYDLGNDFYREWLDETGTYSSALFEHADETLEVAQQRKLDAILARTGARAGDRLLEIGCGWGSFALTAARAGVRVDAITLSTEQKSALKERTSASDGVTVVLMDYRDVTGTYDAVASIEMVEAVGQSYWPDYLATVARVLKPGGRVALQAITIDDAIFERYARNVDFIQRYVFPGGMLLSESRFRSLAEAAGLAWTERVAFGQDYAETLRRWRARFDTADREGRLPQHLSSQFKDLWRYYLMYCQGGFRAGGIDVIQVTLVKR